MTPEKALQLVTKYAILTRSIKECKPAIRLHLDKCDVNHLADWYAKPEPADYETTNYDVPVMISPPGEWLDIGEDQHLECQHCYAAHLVVRERKAMRKQLAIVKRSMSRSKP
jgi:hypothetical protein